MVRKTQARNCPLPVLLFVCLAVLILSVVPARAQSGGWAASRRFFEVPEGGFVQPPFLINDSGGNLHAFWSVQAAASEPMVLYYSRWEGSEWSVPVDVLLSPDGGNIWPVSLEVDQDDYVYAFWVSGDHIWYSAAHASQLDDVHSWAAPRLVSAAYPADPNISVLRDDEGSWFLIYSDKGARRISVIQSTDNATTWSAETLIHLEFRLDTQVVYPGIVVAPDGTLLAWWEEIDPQLSGTGHKAVQSARSTDGGQTWSEPEQVATGYYSGRFEVIDDVMVKMVGGGLGTGGRYISFSYDSGTTWTKPRDIGSGSGEGMQEIDLAVDSAGTWHFLEQTRGFAAIAWNGDTWSPLEFIFQDALGRRSENIVGAISDGNRLHAFSENSDLVLWYTSRVLDAPYVPPRPPRPILTADQEATPEPTAVPGSSTPAAAVPTPDPSGWPDGSEASSNVQGSNQWLPVALGVLPAVSLIVALVFFRQVFGKANR